MTRYMVLRKFTAFTEEPGETKEAWEELGWIDKMPDGDTAARRMSEAMGLDGELVGVPERSFQPETYELERVPHAKKKTKAEGKKAKAAAAS